MKQPTSLAHRDLIQRLIRYKNILTKFRSMGLTRVFSGNLGDAAGISASLVRKDFSLARIAVGQKRGGYPIDSLLKGLDSILGESTLQRVIVVGCGKIGTALMNYPGLSTASIQVVAGFDINPDILDPGAPIPVLHLRQLPDFVREHDIQVAILTVPEPAAADVFVQLADAGVRGVLNFSPVQLKAPSTLHVHNIHIPLEIENLFYHVRFPPPSGSGIKI